MRMVMCGCGRVLLTGDTEAIAQAVSRRLGVDEVSAEMPPGEKVAKVMSLRAASRRVAMVGDGINGAPALIESNLGVAMGSGTDVARESADVVLLGNDFAKFVLYFFYGRCNSPARLARPMAYR